jgi:hypothetical protein
MTATDVISDVAERIGRMTAAKMLSRDASEMRTAEIICGFLAAATVIGAACDFMDDCITEDVASEFVDHLRNIVAYLEEVAA